LEFNELTAVRRPYFIPGSLLTTPPPRCYGKVVSNWNKIWTAEGRFLNLKG